MALVFFFLLLAQRGVHFFRFLQHLLGNIANFSPELNEFAPRSSNSTIFAMSTSKMLVFPMEFAFQLLSPPTSTPIVKISNVIIQVGHP